MSDAHALNFEAAVLAAVSRLREGPASDAAIEQLDRLLRARLLRYFSGTALTGENAEDLVQKTLLAVYSNVDRLEDPRRFLGWLFAIARNVRSTAVEDRRRRERVEVGGVMPPEPACDPLEDGAEDEHRPVAMRAAIDRLPPRQRQCLLLRVRNGMPYEEIAATLCLSANTVRNHLAQARETLRRELAPALEESES